MNTALERSQHILLFKKLELRKEHLHIDKAGGEGTAVLADKAIQAYCKK